FGENSRVLEWVFRRCDGEGETFDTALGLLPAISDLDLDGLEISADALDALLTVDDEAVRGQLPQMEEHLAEFGDELPPELEAQLDALRERLA
ncbi:MAG: phosphoenolpyruvate carboxykinase domain-containing protein, partial [Solirubrobacterales bacterium]